MSTFVRNIGLKRRKVVQSKGLRMTPEIKQCNFIRSSADYLAMSINPFNKNTTQRVYRPYELIAMFYPNQGTDAGERIGNTINLKWMRFKGYITVYDRLISNCRLKFYLVRCYGRDITDVSFVNLFNSWEPVNYSETNLWTLLTAMRHNYYKTTPLSLPTRFGLRVAL